ncbi:MAG: gamma-glutamyl-gamma-aminobutyrate hydrolase family protein, partial [Clostridia bacterium]|nr:gamma-glutamyl-gamma-aminobutyrate hydrolase family protein [Clostridia bacterium]
MIIAITERYEKIDKENIWKENFYISKYFKDIFEELNILLFPVASCTELEKVVSICDGLLVTGSVIDINPKYYGEKRIEQTNILEDYDGQEELDFALIKAFHKAKKPILGICAGVQSINVCFGGSLYQDIPNHSIKGDVKMHKINIEKGSFLDKCYEAKQIEINSFHHQAIKRPAENFKVTATSEDGIIEAIEYENILGVQWHP